jgi:hypothetical protein
MKRLAEERTRETLEIAVRFCLAELEDREHRSGIVSSALIEHRKVLEQWLAENI